MTTIRIHGASDDLVEIDTPHGEPKVKGCDEYSFYATRKEGYLSASDGSVIAIGYSVDGSGCWRVRRERVGSATFTLVRKGDENADSQDGVSGYSDLATLEGDIEWVRWHGKSKFAALKSAGTPPVAKDAPPEVRLLAFCKGFIAEQQITCSETVYQTDRVIENAYAFIEGICDIVGYDRSDEDDELEAKTEASKQ